MCIHSPNISPAYLQCNSWEGCRERDVCIYEYACAARNGVIQDLCFHVYLFDSIHRLAMWMMFKYFQCSGAFPFTVLHNLPFSHLFICVNECVCVCMHACVHVCFLSRSFINLRFLFVINFAVIFLKISIICNNRDLFMHMHIYILMVCYGVCTVLMCKLEIDGTSSVITWFVQYSAFFRC